MAKREFSIPVIKSPPEIPPIRPGAMAHSRPFVAKAEHQEPLGFPGELVDNWKSVAIDKMEELLGKYRALPVFLDSCVKCGACTDKCHYYLGTGDPKNMPVARQDILRSVYRRYFTVAGKYFPKLVGAAELTEEVIDDWYRYYHQCSECRRCSVYCPFGIDTAEITMAGREILASIGVGQKYANEIIGKVHKIGNNLGLPEPALVDTLEGLEEEVEEEINVPVKFPLDQVGAEVLLVTPSADFFAEPHVDGLIGYAKVFHQAGISWTLSSYASEAANFGIFVGNYENMQKVAERIRQAALDLGVKRIVVGECGHAWRVAYSFWNTLIGPFDFLDTAYPTPQHICELTYHLLQQSQLKLDPAQNDDKVVTFHDSCNVSRGSRMGDMPGGQFTIPRALIRSACPHFVDMAPETTHEHTFCCGGGGGLLTDDLLELRVKGALPRVSALKRVIEEDGVTHMAAICAICKSQFSKVLPEYGMGMDMVVSVHQLIGDALVFEPAQ
ncbi:MAG: (Fe-S)-binding protein [Arenicellales bacterium]|nr:(Fe-S)-binding protein [Arenicellales bacterium]MDP6412876.1 (Fe-S)-binding protein [Arenicellales bacterium]MDP7451604.1 (Fe-S)-binding protein [Arenicellales bacterium]MDP7516804.1 (Fe-S)-binding protein [Arenicellales bacterium]MDP7616345.1 (Fe-S)-binding protein [Arenicellales bacterium]|tara:strand:- start:3277 stop:4773 length:1497 start_codon:yes stop_codon:yes gene_type:complete